MTNTCDDSRTDRAEVSVRQKLLTIGRSAAAVLALSISLLVVVPVSSAVAATLTVTLKGAGAGTVASVEATPLLECSNEPGEEKVCTQSFTKAVTLHATPAPGSVFGGWVGSGNAGTCSGGSKESDCLTKSLLVLSASVTATFEPPPPPPQAETVGASTLTFYSGKLEGVVNPEGAPTTECYFEFGTTTNYGHTVPCSQSATEIGSSTAPVPVSATGGLLEASTTYHFRLVAANLGGVSRGEDEILVSAPAPADPCPNAGPRLEQGSGALVLPECRAYELVSNGDSNGIGTTGITTLAESGERLVFSAQAFGQPPSSPGVNNQYLAERDVTGWSIDSEVAPAPSHNIGENPVVDAQWPGLLDFALWGGGSPAQIARGEYQWESSALDGAKSEASELLRPLTSRKALSEQGVAYKFLGGSRDLSRFFFVVKSSGGGQGVTLLPGEPVLASEGNRPHSDLYEIDTTKPLGERLSLVNREGVDGSQIGGSCGADLGDGNLVGSQGVVASAVSVEGESVYFNARPSAPVGFNECGEAATEASYPLRLFKREDAETTVEVDQSECSPACAGPNGDDHFQGASDNGSIVYFTSPRQLLNSDTDSTNDLYLYDSNRPTGERLVQVSAGESIVGKHTAGEGAEVQGVVAIAADGSHAYFVAKGVLASNTDALGEEAAAEKDNLYVYDYDTGNTTFIGELAAADEISLWDQTTELNSSSRGAAALPLTGGGGDGGDGRVLVFASTAPLVPADHDAVSDAYRYDSTTDQLLCISCVGSKTVEVPIASGFSKMRNVEQSFADAPGRLSIATEDGSAIVFTTREQLTPTDTNSVADVYMWRSGELNLVSGGADERGVAEGVRARISPSGSDIFFATTAPLVGTDSGSTLDIYDARVGGGFAAPTEPAPCEGEGCRTAPPPTPSGPSPASPGYSGPTNPPTPAPACRKGSVRRNGKCVKKQPKSKPACRKGSVRRNGKCVKKQPKSKPACRKGSVRRNGKCVKKKSKQKQSGKGRQGPNGTHDKNGGSK